MDPKTEPQPFGSDTPPSPDLPATPSPEEAPAAGRLLAVNVQLLVGAYGVSTTRLARGMGGVRLPRARAFFLSERVGFQEQTVNHLCSFFAVTPGLLLMGPSDPLCLLAARSLQTHPPTLQAPAEALRIASFGDTPLIAGHEIVRLFDLRTPVFGRTSRGWGEATRDRSIDVLVHYHASLALVGLSAPPLRVIPD